MTQQSRRNVHRLDPASPLVADTRELGRRPGSMRRLLRTVAAPAGLGNDVIGVPAGIDLELALRLEAVQEGVLVSGTAQAVATGECVRCLGPLQVDLEVELQELFAYEEARHHHEEVAGESDDAELAVLEGDLVDLEPLLRDAVVLALPLQPVCRDDCSGLCPRCGARLDDDPGHHHDDVDPRWAALQSVFDDERES
ncbi:MAG TPA: YceD family protein [Actinomycetes bacterium]|nr:YceD family protein [Actinomycetes bacterium]